MFCDKSKASEPKPINLSLPTTKAVQFVLPLPSSKLAFLSHGFSKQLSVGFENANLQFINRIVSKRCFVLQHKFHISIKKTLFLKPSLFAANASK